MEIIVLTGEQDACQSFPPPPFFIRIQKNDDLETGNMWHPMDVHCSMQ